MTTVSPINALADAVYGVLAVDLSLTALLPGGVYADVPADPQFPYLWIEVLQDDDVGGLGTEPGRGSMPVMDLRLHVFQSDYGTQRDAAIALEAAIRLLYTPLALEGYTVAGAKPLPAPRRSVFPDEERNGVKVRELVAQLQVVMEETP
jgi:Protein of unknown function (DUF3168)